MSATAKRVYFDRRRAKGTRPGSWVTIVAFPGMIIHEPYETEAMARAAVGLEGGSTDPHYVPEDGTGFEEVAA